MSSKNAKKWAREHVKETQKGFVCELPKVYLYPDGLIPVDIDKPMDADAAPLFMQELYYEIRMEVNRRVAARQPGTTHS
jgi:hypothetical protein